MSWWLRSRVHSPGINMNETDDLFLVLKGRITIQMREGNVTLGSGEMFVVPRGVEHCPVADDEAHLLLTGPTGTPNTGDSASL
jgi:mannose-6-phosphate isomerase-like protein (cupin superfamily)